uniref:Uncharacterized protein n=1 Tax=Setaria viridis TaxID=4556 RepID=A0A4U6U8E3_SETVI|nr:hypothetical protein SEVIR_6G098800v2 [Setaria viridis]
MERPLKPTALAIHCPSSHPALHAPPSDVSVTRLLLLPRPASQPPLAPPAFCLTTAPSACFATAADCSAADQRIGFEIQVFKIGKRNRRLVRARVRVYAPLEAGPRSDYEGLADFIPGLSECRLLDQAHSRPRKVPVTISCVDDKINVAGNARGLSD